MSFQLRSGRSTWRSWRVTIFPYKSRIVCINEKKKKGEESERDFAAKNGEGKEKEEERGKSAS
jgi:hypothetical protein